MQTLMRLKSIVVVPPQSQSYVPYFFKHVITKTSLLQDLKFSMLEDLKVYHKSMSHENRRILHRELTSNYHIQKRPRDPMKAMDELALRLFYEYLIGVVDFKHFTHRQWLRFTRRDPKHQLRIQMLTSCVRKASTKVDQIYSWIRL